MLLKKGFGWEDSVACGGLVLTLVPILEKLHVHKEGCLVRGSSLVSVTIPSFMRR